MYITDTMVTLGTVRRQKKKEKKKKNKHNTGSKNDGKQELDQNLGRTQVLAKGK